MYQTKQKKLLVDFFKNNTSKQFSINEIVNNLCDDGSGKSTIYRLVSKMVSEGTLIRLSGKSGKNVVYQYVGKDTNCHEHFHLKCNNCGKIIHLECPQMNEIGDHILNEHSFSVDLKKSVLYGLCSQCR